MINLKNRAFLSIAVMASLTLFTVCASCAADEGAPGDDASGVEDGATSILEGIEIVETIPPSPEGDEPQPLTNDGPRRGGVLAAPMMGCTSPDPAIDGATLLRSIERLPLVTEIHAGLMSLNDDPNSPVEFNLAESYEVLEQGLVYEFKLRQGLKFSDGSPLTAKDVKWSWERALKKSVTAGWARDVLGPVVGSGAVIDGSSNDLEGVTVVDDRTLSLRLNEPRAEFIVLLADPVASVLKKGNVDEWGIEWDNPAGIIPGRGFDATNMPVGAGPFKLTEYFWAPLSERCAIARNPHYWGRPAHLDGVWFRTEVFKTETDTSEESMMFYEIDPLAFANEVVDYEGMSFGDSDEDLIEVRDAQELSQTPAPAISFLVLNPSAPPFDDINFRRAVVASAALTSLRGYADGDRRLITAHLTTLELTDIHPRFDIELATAELAASKYAEHAEEWDIAYLQPDYWGITFEELDLFGVWRDVLNLNIDDSKYRSTDVDSFEGRYNNRMHMRMFHQVPGYADPSAVLRSMIAPFGEQGTAPEFVEFEAMMDAAAVESDVVKRHEMYLDIEAYLADQALVIPYPVFDWHINYRTQPWVHDLNLPKYPSSTFHDVWLDTRAPQRELPSQ